MSNIRIRTTPGGEDKYLSVNLNQDFDFIEILSLKLKQEDIYRNFCSDYGVVVGRVIVNQGLGVPNAKVSIFIPIDEIDKENTQLFGLYPYEKVTDTNSEGIRYNLFQKNNTNNNNCYTPIGSFPTKREVQDNDDLLYLYKKYYKFTTTTNQSGDYMFFGVPVGAHQIQVDADLSDIGILSLKPYNLIAEGYNANLFDGALKFKQDNNLNLLAQVKSKTPLNVNVQPFWGEVNQCQIGISRLDVDLNVNVKPHAIFMGSLMTDNENNSLDVRCRAKSNLGKLSQLIPTRGTIEMIRKTVSGGIETFNINDSKLIDENGTWLYTIPMNLDYVLTSEFGELIPTDDPNKGIPTRASVRFRIGANSTGTEGKKRRRAYYLVPNNPSTPQEVDYTFDETTKDSSFVDLYWNKIYTVANHISRIQKTSIENANSNQNGIFIKSVNDETTNNPFPYNKIYKNTFGNIQLNFFNDWINGTLYYFLFDYKERSKDFCNIAKIGNSTIIVDNCTNCPPQNDYNNNYYPFPNDEVDGTVTTQNLPSGRGVIFSTADDELYYASKDILTSIRLYATKIINLGSLLDCDWQSTPIFYKYLVTTTFKIQPDEVELDDDNTVLTNGIVPVIKAPGNVGYNIKDFNCNNVKRLCELGVGLDEYRLNPSTQSGSSADGFITNTEVEQSTIRGLFAYLNSNNLPNVPSIFFDNTSNYDYGNQPYRDFKGYNTLNNSNTVWLFDNSFYFYFGLTPGKTALDRLYTEYLGNC